MSCRRTQRSSISAAQTAKIKTRKVAQPLSMVPLGARKIRRSSSRISANPPNHNVVRPNLLLGRRTLRSRALISLDSGSLNTIGSWNYCCSVAFGASLTCYGYAPGNVSMRRTYGRDARLLRSRDKDRKTPPRCVRNCRSISSFEPSIICSVTCASCPFFSFTAPSPTSATSSDGRSRIPYTRVNFAIP